MLILPQPRENSLASGDEHRMLCSCKELIAKSDQGRLNKIRTVGSATREVLSILGRHMQTGRSRHYLLLRKQHWIISPEPNAHSHRKPTRLPATEVDVPASPIWLVLEGRSRARQRPLASRFWASSLGRGPNDDALTVPSAHLKNAPPITVLAPPVKVTLNLTWPEMFQIR